MMDYKQIGQRIREEREKFGLAREKFAEILELSPNFVGQIERGERPASLKTMVKISDTLRTPLDYLVKGNNVDEDEKAEIGELSLLLEKCSNHELSVITDIIKVVLPNIKSERNTR